MFEDGSPADFQGQIRSIAAALGLPYSPDMQDWGIAQNDPNRMNEFIEFFEREDSPGWHEYVIYQFVDLILQSADSALEDHPDACVDAVRGFLDSLHGRGDQGLRYWMSLRSPGREPWPIVEQLAAWGY